MAKNSIFKDLFSGKKKETNTQTAKKDVAVKNTTPLMMQSPDSTASSTPRSFAALKFYGSENKTDSTTTNQNPAPKGFYNPEFAKKEEKEEAKNPPVEIILNDAQIAKAKTWYEEQCYSKACIQAMQKLVQRIETGVLEDDDLQALAGWQKSQHLAHDGKVGKLSLKKAGIEPTYDLEVHTLGSTTASWCDSKGFVYSSDLSTLASGFQAKAKAVLGALKKAGVSFEIDTTLRHSGRAAVMYYSRYFYDESRKKAAQERLRGRGYMLDGTAKGAAEAVTSFGIGKDTSGNLNPVGLNSNHCNGDAVDFTISPGSLAKNTELDIDGFKKVTVGSGSSDEERLSKTLQAAGYEGFNWYGTEDPVHWSTTGK